MRMMTTVLLAATLSGCGYKAEIEQLQADLAAVRGQLSDRDQSLDEAEAEIARMETAYAALEGELDDAQAELTALEAELDVEREKSARILADRGALRDEIAQMTQAMDELAARKRSAEARVAAYRDLVDRFKTLIDAGTLDVRLQDGRMIVVLKTDILFGSGSADLSDDGKDALTQVSEVLASIPDRRFQIEGHTDNVPIKTARYPSNWFLAAARAIGVVNHMIGAGMPASRVSAAAFGDTRPVADNETPEGKAQNRRIEIVVVPDLSDMPGYDELKAIESE